MGEKERFHSIDLMEFLGMLFVLIYHATLFPYNFMAGSGEGLYYFNYILRGLLSTCVPMFFFANGFLLFGAELDLKKHLLKMLRLVAVTVLGGAVILVPIMFMEHEILSPAGFFNALWTWRQGWINHLWFMGALVCVYVFFPLLKTAFDHSKRAFIWFTAVAAALTFGNTLLCAGGTVLLDVLGRGDHLVDFSVFNIFDPFRGIFGYAFVYFCAGGLVRWQTPRMQALMARARGRMNAGAIAVLVLETACLGLWGIYCSRLSGALWDNVWEGYDTVFTFAGVLAMFVLCQNYRAAHRWGRAIRLVSENTLGIFIFHIVFSRLMRGPAWHFPFMRNPICNVLFALAVMGVTLAFVLAGKRVWALIMARLRRPKAQKE